MENLHSPINAEEPIGEVRMMATTVDMLRDVDSAPNQAIGSVILNEVTTHGELPVDDLVRSVAAQCKVGQPEALYQVWALIERDQLDYERGMRISLPGR